MKYSIILPIYNIQEIELRKCLNSLLGGRPSNVELILVDDNNNQDISGAVCDEYAKKYNDIKCIHQVNQGVSVARNAGLSLSRGEYILFVDPDDWVTEDFYDQLDTATQLYSNSDIILFAAWVNYKEIEIKNSFWNKSRKFSGKEKEKLQLQLIAKGVTDYFPPEIGAGVPWARLYKKTFIDTFKLQFQPDLKRMQDNIFNMYAFEYANEIIYIDHPIYHYRKSMTSVTNKKNDKVIEHFEKVNKAVAEFVAKFQKDPIFSSALNIKRLIGINSYYNLYFRHYRNVSEFKTMSREYKKLLESFDYRNSLQKIDYSYLLPKERIFIRVVQTKSLRLLDILQKGETALRRLKKRNF